MAPPAPADNKDAVTARKLVEKTKDLAEKLAEAKTTIKVKEKGVEAKDTSLVEKQVFNQPEAGPKGRISALADRIGALVGSTAAEPSGQSQPEIALMEQFNAQFGHFQDDAPACDICGAITVRNGMCYKCYNCGNSMGCS
jgi:ribonucleoside-diphosphate reductase alpha chain